MLADNHQLFRTEFQLKNKKHDEQNVINVNKSGSGKVGVHLECLNTSWIYYVSST
jgi:hypothetical protein